MNMKVSEVYHHRIRAALCFLAGAAVSISIIRAVSKEDANSVTIGSETWYLTPRDMVEKVSWSLLDIGAILASNVWEEDRRIGLRGSIPPATVWKMKWLLHEGMSEWSRYALTEDSQSGREGLVFKINQQATLRAFLDTDANSECILTNTERHLFRVLLGRILNDIKSCKMLHVPVSEDRVTVSYLTYEDTTSLEGLWNVNDTLLGRIIRQARKSNREKNE